MPTPGNRKQRYVLDIDDIVRDGFMTLANAEALMRGLNGSGGTVKLSVPMGGTNNGVFVDQELLKYDAATGKIVSSGFTSGGGGGGTVFVPWETGAFFRQDGMDTITTSLVEMAVVDQNFNLPANSLWSELEVTFGFKITGVSGTMKNLQVRLQSEATPNPSILQPSSSLIYSTAGASDSAAVTWIAKGSVPSTMANASVLRVRLFGIPQDVPAQRTLITRLSYRGAVPAPSGGSPKGIPVFLTSPQIVYNTPASVGWTTFDLTPYVPDGASAVIMWAQIREHETGSSDTLTPSTINYRANSGGYIYSLGSAMCDNGDDTDTSVAQMILPFDTSGTTRSCQFSVTNNPNYGVTIVLLGYIT